MGEAELTNPFLKSGERVEGEQIVSGKKDNPFASKQPVQNRFAGPGGPNIKPEGRQSDVSFAEAVGRGGAVRFLDNIFEAPEDVTNRVSVGAKRAGPVQPGITSLGANALRLVMPSQPVDFPNPTAEDVMAAGQMAGEGVGFAEQTIRGGARPPVTGFDEAKRQQGARNELAAQEQPLGTGIGRAGGDVATLAMGRAPVVRAMRDDRLARDVTEGAAETATRRGKRTPPQNTMQGVKNLVSKKLETDTVKTIAESAGRAAGVGVEGAALAILNDGDPVEMAAYGTGGQLVGGALLSGFPVFSRPKKAMINFGMGILGLTALARTAQEFGPGDNNIYEAGDFAFNKAKWAIVAGAASSLVGAGRKGGEMADQLPVLADTLATIPRGAVLSVLNESLKDDRLIPIMSEMSSNPQAFDKDVQRKITKAINTNTVPETIDKLMKNKKFRQKFEQLQ